MGQFNPLPTVGTSGVWVFDSSIIAAVNVQAIYSCQAISSIRDMIVRGEDVLNNIYIPLGLTEADYLSDAASTTVVIVTLVGNDNSFLRMPNNRILELPSIDGKLYSTKVLKVTLGATPIAFDPTGLFEELKAYIYGRLGIESEISLDGNPVSFVVDYQTHEILEIERENRRFTIENPEYVIRERDREIERLGATIKTLEDFIKAKCAAGELTGC